MSEVLVAGASGFIGRALTVALLQEGMRVRTFSRTKPNLNEAVGLRNLSNHVGDFTTLRDFRSVVEGCDTVFHLISTTKPASSMQDIPGGIAENLVQTASLLDACIKEGVKEVVFLSSGGTVYGSSAKLPCSEDDPVAPISPYGYQKAAVEQLLELFWKMYGLDYRVVRLSNPYGPGQNPDKGFGVITSFIWKALNEQPLQIFGDGGVVRDFIYVDDAIDGLINIARCQSSRKVFNLGSGVGNSVAEIAFLVKKLVNPDCSIEYLPHRHCDIAVNYLDVSAYRALFGDPCLISLEEGIRLTSEYFVRRGKD